MLKVARSIVAGKYTLDSISVLGNVADLVHSILMNNQKLITVKTAQEKTILQRQIDATDRRIDELVYELYGLTEEEIKIVEGSNEGK